MDLLNQSIGIIVLMASIVISILLLAVYVRLSIVVNKLSDIDYQLHLSHKEVMEDCITYIDSHVLRIQSDISELLDERTP